MGLNVLLDIETKHSLGMAKPIYGAEVLIHDAEDFPQASLTSGIAQPGHDMDMAIVPSVIISKPAIRGVPVDVRQCYFADEEKLRATQKYSQNSCMAECQVNYIISKCSCIPFFFPEPPSIGNKYRQCVLNDVDCLRRNQGKEESLGALEEKTKSRLDFNYCLLCIAQPPWPVFSRRTGRRALIPPSKLE